MVKWKGLILGLLFVLMAHSYGAVYIFPPDYDDIKSTVQNGSTIVRITESSSTSLLFYTVSTESGSYSVRYRCASVPKIPCSTGNIDVYASPISVFLIRNTTSGQSAIGVASWDIVAENTGSSFNICAMFLSEDGNTYFSTHDESNFSTDTDPKSNVSYVYLNIRQVCR